MAAVALLAGGIFRERQLATSPTRAVTPNQLRPRRSRYARTRRSDCEAIGELTAGAEDRPAPEAQQNGEQGGKAKAQKAIIAPAKIPSGAAKRNGGSYCRSESAGGVNFKNECTD